MTDDAIKHVQALRDGLAAELNKDPRVLTLQALDKTLAELKLILEPAGAAAAAPDSSLVARLNALSPSHAAPRAPSLQIARVA